VHGAAHDAQKYKIVVVDVVDVTRELNWSSEVISVVVAILLRGVAGCRMSLVSIKKLKWCRGRRREFEISIVKRRLACLNY
jgi:hypothetical protein